MNADFLSQFRPETATGGTFVSTCPAKPEESEKSPAHTPPHDRSRGDFHQEFIRHPSSLILLPSFRIQLSLQFHDFFDPSGMAAALEGGREP